MPNYVKKIMASLDIAHGKVEARREVHEQAMKETIALMRPDRKDALPERGELVRLLREVRDRGLIYWEPNTDRGYARKADLLERIDAVIAEIEGDQ